MIIFEIFVTTIIVAALVFMFFMFDGVILNGVFQRKIQRWAENKFENDCNQDCNQGRNCKCAGK